MFYFELPTSIKPLTKIFDLQATDKYDRANRGLPALTTVLDDKAKDKKHDVEKSPTWDDVWTQLCQDHFIHHYDCHNYAY